MKQLIVRADDFGLSEAVSLGILSAHENGIVTCTSMIVNTPFATKAATLLQNHPNLCTGLHINLIVGSPCSQRKYIPSLLNDDQLFISSKIRRDQIQQGQDTFVYNDVITEVRAQVEQFIKITGNLPKYIDEHAVSTTITKKAILTIAKEYGIKHIGNQPNNKFAKVICTMSPYDFYKTNKPIANFFTQNYIKLSKQKINLIVFHPGFLDQTILNLSSLTLNRIKDHDLLINNTVKEWLAKKNIKLISFCDF